MLKDDDPWTVGYCLKVITPYDLVLREPFELTTYDRVKVIAMKHEEVLISNE